MSDLEHSIIRFLRTYAVGPAHRAPRERREIELPGERIASAPRRLLVAYALAAILPVVTAALLVPFREAHPQTITLVLVVPVVLVAVQGATGPAIAAALVAGSVYSVFLTEPYGRLVIADGDDVVAAVTLVAVATTVGFLSSRVSRLSARDAVRRDELGHLSGFVRSVVQVRGRDQLVDAATKRLTDLLCLDGCQWQEGYHGGAAPVLLPDGMVMGYLTELQPDRAQLPRHLELPAMAGGDEVGRFLLVAKPNRAISREERVTAVSIAQLFAAVYSQRRPTGERDPGR